MPPVDQSSPHPRCLSYLPSAVRAQAYEAVIGIETHVQLSTATKAFCSCTNEYGAEANAHVCPVCLGHPVRTPTQTPGRRHDAHTSGR